MNPGRIETKTISWMHSHPRKLLLEKVASVLQSRDRKICCDLYEHKVLTTQNISDLYFDSSRLAQRRLLKLHDLAVVQRFRPLVEIGSAPFHFVLGELGILIVAAERGVEPKELKYSKHALSRLAYSQRLSHLIAVNTFFSRLAAACRENKAADLTDWWSENRTRSRWGRVVLPDAFGRIEGPSTSLSFFLEMDRGTEQPWRLEAKLDGYRDASLLSDAPEALLFCFPDVRREASARRALRACPIGVATATLDRHISDPFEANWLPLWSTQRVKLLDLPAEIARRGVGR